MASTENLNIGMAVLSSLGGCMGYAKKGSVPSLVGGVGLGAAYGVSAWLCDENPSAGYTVGLAASVVMAIVGAMRYKKSKKVMPAGMLLIMGLFAGVCNLFNIV
eukprot:CAMPEP_0174324496 /NCGR_PEP_ID=MMETSP0810-20121108/12545_1 /TAXON_ID=73025 ORGANISM="Eutreptiella gymnastica-like, Strain CCMP1594" /NCGR_SAMPLE_ID=MMETSP0810 /ASSEMBLY_ACC=CAM_ASM_000659 /LENGTH=103 /DNA_ID=CAMNT_0015437341 /DNA_START=25 /DNA_END=336 /DNA_ORIENTATION=-